jgi:hypothetical protein
VGGRGKCPGAPSHHLRRQRKLEWKKRPTERYRKKQKREWQLKKKNSILQNGHICKAFYKCQSKHDFDGRFLRHSVQFCEVFIP